MSVWLLFLLGLTTAGLALAILAFVFIVEAHFLQCPDVRATRSRQVGERQEKKTKMPEDSWYGCGAHQGHAKKQDDWLASQDVCSWQGGIFRTFLGLICGWSSSSSLSSRAQSQPAYKPGVQSGSGLKGGWLNRADVLGEGLLRNCSELLASASDSSGENNSKSAPGKRRTARTSATSFNFPSKEPNVVDPGGTTATITATISASAQGPGSNQQATAGRPAGGTAGASPLQRRLVLEIQMAPSDVPDGHGGMLPRATGVRLKLETTGGGTSHVSSAEIATAGIAQSSGGASLAGDPPSASISAGRPLAGSASPLPSNGIATAGKPHAGPGDGRHFARDPRWGSASNYSATSHPMTPFLADTTTPASGKSGDGPSGSATGLGSGMGLDLGSGASSTQGPGSIGGSIRGPGSASGTGSATGLGTGRVWGPGSGASSRDGSGSGSGTEWSTGLEHGCGSGSGSEPGSHACGPGAGASCTPETGLALKDAPPGTTGTRVDGLQQMGFSPRGSGPQRDKTRLADGRTGRGEPGGADRTGALICHVAAPGEVLSARAPVPALDVAKPHIAEGMTAGTTAVAEQASSRRSTGNGVKNGTGVGKGSGPGVGVASGTASETASGTASGPGPGTALEAGLGKKQGKALNGGVGTGRGGDGFAPAAQNAVGLGGSTPGMKNPRLPNQGSGLPKLEGLEGLRISALECGSKAKASRECAKGVTAEIASAIAVLEIDGGGLPLPVDGGTAHGLKAEAGKLGGMAASGGASGGANGIKTAGSEAGSEGKKLGVPAAGGREGSGFQEASEKVPNGGGLLMGEEELGGEGGSGSDQGLEDAEDHAEPASCHAEKMEGSGTGCNDEGGEEDEEKRRERKRRKNRNRRQKRAAIAVAARYAASCHPNGGLFHGTEALEAGLRKGTAGQAYGQGQVQDAGLSGAQEVELGCPCGAVKGSFHAASCPYPFTSPGSSLQRKIKEQYDGLVRANAAKTLTLAQVGRFTTCLVEAKAHLQHKSETLQRRFTIARSLLAKVEKPSFDRLCSQIHGLEVEQKRLEEDTVVYNRLQEQLKQSPAYQKMLEYGRAHFELQPSTGQLVEKKGEEEEEEEEISFEELLAQEKKDALWHKHGLARHPVQVV